MKTLNELCEFINSAEEWSPEMNEIISANGWKDETGETYGICSNGKERLQFNEKGFAEIVDM